MARDLLISVRERLTGAQEEFERLQREVEAFADREPYRVVQEHNPEFTQHTLRLVFDEPFPGIRWGRMFGSGVQHLRSALDHLIYAIAIHESGTDPPPKATILAFPSPTNPKKGAPMWRVASLSEKVRAAIQGEQPDPDRPHTSPLWHLDEFNRPDKHRTVHFTMVRTAQAQVLVDDLTPGQHTFTWHVVALEDEAPFLTITSEHPSPDVKMGSASAGFVGVERVGWHGKPKEFLPIGNVCEDLTTGTLGIVERVATTAGLDPAHAAPPEVGST